MFHYSFGIALAVLAIAIFYAITLPLMIHVPQRLDHNEAGAVTVAMQNFITSNRAAFYAIK